MRVLTLTRASGRFNFAPNQTIDIADGQDLEDLIACGAVKPLEDKSTAPEKPSRRSKSKAAEPEREKNDGAPQDS